MKMYLAFKLACFCGMTFALGSLWIMGLQTLANIHAVALRFATHLNDNRGLSHPEKTRTKNKSK